MLNESDSVACMTLDYSAAQEKPDMLLTFTLPTALRVLACNSMQMVYRLLTPLHVPARRSAR